MAEATTQQKPKYGKPDTYIIGIYITLLLVSLVETYSASSREISTSLLAPMISQLLFLGLSLAITFIFARMNYTKFTYWGKVFLVVSLGFMVYAWLFGENINGAQRAVRLPGFTVQPAELAKLSIVFWLSFIMAKNIDRKLGRIKDRGMWFSLLSVAIFGLFLVMQGMTNALLFGCISLALFVIGKINYKKFMLAVSVLLLVLLALAGFKSCVEEHALDDLEKTEQTDDTEEAGPPRKKTWSARLERFAQRWDPNTPLYLEPISSENDQEMFSHMAQANGGVFGVLPGNSRECSRLPLAFSDYVFSIVVEDMGLAGGLFLIGLYFVLIIRAGAIARRCRRAYPAFLVMGMAVMVVLQAFFHIAINTGVFPVSGQPLPLISKGGTSIAVVSVAFGVMLSISRTATQKATKKDIKREDEALPESMRVANPTMTQ